MSKRYLYLFYGVLTDYTSGIAGSIAENKNEAINNIVKKYEKWEKEEREYSKKVQKMYKSKEYISMWNKFLSTSSPTRKNILNKKVESLYPKRPEILLNHIGTVVLDMDMNLLKKELMQCKNVKRYELTDDVSFFIGGGS
jgi:hypothetical protein